MRASQIIGIGGFVPERTVTNFDLEKILDTTDEWITQRTGIKSRHWVTSEVATSDLALQACQAAMKNAGVTADQVDMLIVATITPDYDLPGTAAILQTKLNMRGKPYFEIRQACSGFLYALSLADQYIKSGAHKTILIVGAEVQSKVLDMSPAGRQVSVIFGDGAGAAIVRAVEATNPKKDKYIINTLLGADGAGAMDLCIQAPGTAMGATRLNAELMAQGKHFGAMNGRAVFEQAVKKMPEILQKNCKESGYALSDIDMFFFHQANARINTHVADELGLDSAKVHSTIQKFGNTTAATIPLGMWDALQAGKLKPGMLIALTAFGAGFTWGTSLVRY